MARLEVVPRLLFPPPSQIATAGMDWWSRGELLRDVAASLWRALTGYAVGVLVGILLGLATARNRVCDVILRPAIHALRPIPPVAMVPLVIVWFGIGDGAKLFSIALATFFPTWIAMHLGARDVPEEYLWSARLLGASRRRILLRIVLPAAMSSAASGLRTAVSVAFVMVFVSELAGASSGVGYQISASHLAYRIDRMMAALVVLGALGVGVDALVALLLRTIMPWKEQRHG